MKRIWAFFITTVMMMAMVALPVRAVEPNLVTNGDFEAGITGFTSDYDVLDPINTGDFSLYPEKLFTVSTDPRLYHNLWASFGDHTSSSGKMMIINGLPAESPDTVWQQDVTIPARDQVNDPIPVLVPAESTFKLWAGQSNNVGDVYVKDDGENICVKFVLYPEKVAEGWIITETHVAVGDDLEDIPQKNGNPIPGQFPEGESNIRVTETGWYCIPKTGMTFPYAVAAHAVVKKIQAAYHVDAPCLVSGVGSDNVKLLAEDAVNPGYPVGYTAPYQTTYTDGVPSVLAFVHSAWLPFGIEGANWISSDYFAENPDYNTWRLFRRSFDIPLKATNITGTLMMNSDNAETAYVNGAFVGDGSPAIVYGASIKDVSPPSGIEHGWNTVEGPFDLTLTSGTNKLWIMTRNYAWSGGSQANPTALTYKLCYSYDMPEVILKSDTAWGGEVDFPGKNWANYIIYSPETRLEERERLVDTPTNYTFSFWAANSHPDNPAVLAAYLNDTEIGEALHLDTIDDLGDPMTGTWKQFSVILVDPNPGSYTIKIVDTYTEAWGDDFCIDDISLIKAVAP